MKKKVIKSKSRRFSFGGKSLEIIDWGYNDFKYIEPITTPRYLNHYSLHFVVKGCGTFNYGKNTHQISEKSVFCLKPNVLISYYPNKNDPWRYFWINFRGEESEDILSSMGFTGSTSVKSSAQCETVYATFESILNGGYSQKECYFKIKSALYDAASLLCNDKTAETFIKGSDLVKRVKDVLQLNYKNSNFSIEALSDIMHVSHSYVCRLFKEATGQTVVKYLMNLRLEKAAELIKTGNYLVKDLAYSVGFNDELHFMKEFKKKFGVTVKTFKGEALK